MIVMMMGVIMLVGNAAGEPEVINKVTLGLSFKEREREKERVNTVMKDFHDESARAGPYSNRTKSAVNCFCFQRTFHRKTTATDREANLN
jgi:hypothetical protein